MEFLVLGPLEVRHDGQLIELRGSKRRALLALLILHANEVVRTDRLVDELWGEHPPENAAAALQSHVSRLRKAVGADVLVTKPWGYVLRADPQTIDLQRFETLVAEARTLAAQERRERLRDALALWRGPALADVASEPALATEVARLDELRLLALEQRIDTDLELGGNPELVAELESLVAKHPLRERLRGQLILALYRAGRQAEALEAYRETRRVLVDELGIEPSPELRELELAILRQDPALVVAPPAAAAASAGEPPSRWRWPRSPLAIAAALLFLGAAGAGAALLVTGGGPSEGSAAGPPPTPGSTTQPTAPAHPIAATTGGKAEHPKRPDPTGHTVAHTTTAAVTTAPEPPAHHEQPPPPAPAPATTTAVTHPLPPATTTTQTTTRAQAQRDWVYWLTDDFDDPAFDDLTWRWTAADGISSDERGGHAEFAVDPGAVSAGPNAATYTTQCSFGKDFDVQVDFQLLTWPPGNGATVFLSPLFQGADTWTFVGRKGRPSDGPEPERYASAIRRYVAPEAPAADSSGALRLKRTGRSLTTYYRSHGTWVKLASGDAAGLVWLAFGVSVEPLHLGREPIVVAFDNFRATAPDKQYSVECEGVPYPPRRPPP
jgi:DNA-binding SARP family transcriptional activator